MLVHEIAQHARRAELRHQVDVAAPRAHAVEVQHVGVVQLRQQRRLRAQLVQLRRVGDVGKQLLERDGASSVRAAEHHAKGPTTDALVHRDLVRGDGPGLVAVQEGADAWVRPGNGASVQA